MTHEPRVLIHPSKHSLVTSVSTLFLTQVKKTLAEQDTMHILLTGGTVGSAVLEAVKEHDETSPLDWTNVHFWWGDERFLDKHDQDRNETQSHKAFLDHIIIPKKNIHPFPARNEIPNLDQAASWYEKELATWGSEGNCLPSFDITFLGVGPDGHIASLFPEHDGIHETTKTVVVEKNSPKPPPERLSLTRDALNSSQHIWLVLAGQDKASALGLALAKVSYSQVPAAGMRGKKDTVFFVDHEAALNVPAALLSSE